MAFVLFFLAAFPPLSLAQPAPMRVHDPRIIKAGDWYYLFSTGIGIGVWRSHDLATWERDGVVFTQAPTSALGEFPRGNYLWAPDVTFFGGQFHLYYAVSHFGLNDSAIAHATNPTLDRNDEHFHWTDRGIIVRTRAKEDWNAIDPAVYLDHGKTPWMVAGSFWSGIKLIRLNPQTGDAIPGDPIALARRPKPDAIEGGCIFHHGDFYYLLVSFDYCCMGARSTYKLMIGRSRDLGGPYLDFDDRPMLEGGGTLVLASYGHIRGPGHAGVFSDGGRDLLVHHYYDADDDGRSKVQVRPLLWPPDGWPLAGEPIAPATPAFSPASSPASSPSFSPPTTSASISSATKPTTLAGRWLLSINFDDPFALELFDDGSTRPDIGRWSATDSTVTFSPSNRLHSHRSDLICLLSPDRASFIGRSKDGAVIRAVRR